MATPVFIDGPLKGITHEVDDSTIEQGTYAFQKDSEGPGLPPPPVVFYTFARVQLLGRTVVVASGKSGMISYPELFAALTTPAAQAAAE